MIALVELVVAFFEIFTFENELIYLTYKYELQATLFEV